MTGRTLSTRCALFVTAPPLIRLARSRLQTVGSLRTIMNSTSTLNRRSAITTVKHTTTSSSTIMSNTSTLNSRTAVTSVVQTTTSSSTIITVTATRLSGKICVLGGVVAATMAQEASLTTCAGDASRRHFSSLARTALSGYSALSALLLCGRSIPSRLEHDVILVEPDAASAASAVSSCSRCS